MDGTSRQPTPDLTADLFAHPEMYSFFRAVELLLKEHNFEVEERALHAQMVDGLRFSVAPNLGFPKSDVDKVTRDIFDPDGITDVTVTFLGLHGSSSPLPSHLLEQAAWSEGEESVLRNFNDFFSHRLIWLFYLIWRKYRYFIRYKPEASDLFSEWMFSLIGIGGEESRGAAGIPWAKLLTYLGVLAARTRSAEMISGVLAHAFALKKVTIRQMERRRVEIPEDQRNGLGMLNSTLGQDFTIGSWVQDIQGKFTIVLHELSFERFRDFLPSGEDFGRMRELVEFLLKDQFAYDFELRLIAEEAPSFELISPRDGQDIDEGRKARLGWTTFIGTPPEAGPDPIILQARG